VTFGIEVLFQILYYSDTRPELVLKCLGFGAPHDPSWRLEREDLEKGREAIQNKMKLGITVE